MVGPESPISDSVDHFRLKVVGNYISNFPEVLVECLGFPVNQRERGMIKSNVYIFNFGVEWGTLRVKVCYKIKSHDLILVVVITSISILDFIARILLLNDFSNFAVHLRSHTISSVGPRTSSQHMRALDGRRCWPLITGDLRASSTRILISPLYV